MRGTKQRPPLICLLVSRPNRSSSQGASETSLSLFRLSDVRILYPYPYRSLLCSRVVANRAETVLVLAIMCYDKNSI